MKLYPVNEALTSKLDLDGKRISLEGLLSFQHESICIVHWPKSEQIQNNHTYHSVWVEAAGEEQAGAYRYNIAGLEKLAGKRVVCFGEFQSKPRPAEESWHSSYGHMGMWPAQLLATELVYYKTWYAANGTLET